MLRIRGVNSSGIAEDLGDYNHARKRLTLHRHGYPLLGPGEHRIHSSMPWVLQDMTPSGYVGRGIARNEGWPADPRLWSDEHALLILQRYGWQLTGNIVLGDSNPSAVVQGEVHQTMEELVDDTLHSQAAKPSSAGGEQPKLVLNRVIVKFSPTIGSPYHRRWSDLLIAEAHCLRTLAAHGVPAATATSMTGAKRTWLEVDRFDRVGQHGRLGAVTWTWLDADLYGTGDAAQCALRLHSDGHLTVAELKLFQRAHSFSAAIGNNDTHLGNYGLLFDDDGHPQLAPLYDVLPMAFAPTFDGLPEPKPAPVIEDHRVVAMVDDLADRIVNDLTISDDFKSQWLQHVRRS